MTNSLLFINIGAQEGIILLIFAVAALAPLIFVVLALIDIFKRDFGDKTADRIMLLILILLVPIIGSIIYFVALRDSYPLKRKQDYLNQ